jgi:signal transduction histidine kinase
LNFFRLLPSAWRLPPRKKMRLLENAANFFAKQSRRLLFVEAVSLVVAIGLIDYITGYEVSFFPFYSIPILLIVWFGDRKMAVLIAVLSASAWWLADVASGHIYSREWLRIWDSIVRLMFFCLVVFAGSAFRAQRDANRAQIALLERSQRLEQEIISISEREQLRVGRDLHDSLGQYLVAIGFAADTLKEDLQRESLHGAAAAGQIAELLHDAVRRARDLARGLSPVDKHEGGLESALEELTLSTSRLTGIPCSFISDGQIAGNNVRDLHLFRIAQEALNNSAKHSHASAIVIALDAGDGDLCLRICDDGVGFDSTRTVNGGMGLNIMRYRAEMIGGTLEIQANSPSGTVLSCTITATPEETHPS